MLNKRMRYLLVSGVVLIGLGIWPFRMLLLIGDTDSVSYTHWATTALHSGSPQAGNLSISVHADGTVMLSAARDPLPTRVHLERGLHPTPLLFARLACQADAVWYLDPQHAPEDAARRLLADLRYPPADIAEGNVPLAAAAAVVRDFRSACGNPFRDRYQIGRLQARCLLARLAACDWDAIAAIPRPTAMFDMVFERHEARWQLPGAQGANGGIGYEAAPFAEVEELLAELRDELEGQPPLPDGSDIDFSIPGVPTTAGRTVQQWVHVLNDTGAQPYLHEAAMQALLRAGYRFPDGSQLPAAVRLLPPGQQLTWAQPDLPAEFVRRCNLLPAGDTRTETVTAAPS